jgi:hypothetical protein
MSLLDQAKSLFQPEPVKREWYEELEENVCSMFPSMTWQQRIYGCAICMVIGFCLSMGSLFRLIELLHGDPVPFAIMYTLGNIISISATCFLYGPWSQAKQMFAPTRFITTVVYVLFMGLTLFLAFYPEEIPVRVLWLVLSILAQFLALVWYTLSYIPFGRDFVSKFFRETCCCAGDCCKESGPEPASAWFS